MFEGVDVHDSNVGNLEFGAAFTTPLTGRSISFSYYGNKPKAKKHLLRHEFGHILQDRRYGGAYFYGVVVPVSIASVLSDDPHQETWVEKEANTLSYIYFQMPTDWNTTDYPIDGEYMAHILSADEKK
jgi:hypothetical protein